MFFHFYLQNALSKWCLFAVHVCFFRWSEIQWLWLTTKHQCTIFTKTATKRHMRRTPFKSGIPKELDLGEYKTALSYELLFYDCLSVGGETTWRESTTTEWETHSPPEAKVLSLLHPAASRTASSLLVSKPLPMTQHLKPQNHKKTIIIPEAASGWLKNKIAIWSSFHLFGQTNMNLKLAHSDPDEKSWPLT